MIDHAVPCESADSRDQSRPTHRPERAGIPIGNSRGGPCPPYVLGRPAQVLLFFLKNLGEAPKPRSARPCHSAFGAVFSRLQRRNRTCAIEPSSASLSPSLPLTP